MITHPLAKINLGLYVVARRTDGYHDLETAFYPIPIHDTLEVEPAESDSFALEGIPLAGEVRDNLVVRVVELLRRRFDIPPVSVRLTKGIPSGAGLGGGSSDAAYMMTMLNEMFSLGLSVEDMETEVSHLGADCAFFIRRRPVLATGIGNIFSPLKLDLSGYTLVLVKPDDFVSTREAYASVRPMAPKEPLRAALGRDVATWRSHVENDFEQSLFSAHPTIERIKDVLYQFGAEFALMSGSGSTVFALFRPEKAEEETLRAAFADCFFYMAPSL